MFESPEQAHQALTEVGYLTDRVTATTVYLADRLHKPLLLEGPAGSGKTELSYAVTRAAHTTIERLQCFEGITAEHAIGKFDESLQRLYLEHCHTNGEAGLEGARTGNHDARLLYPRAFAQGNPLETTLCAADRRIG